MPTADIEARSDSLTAVRVLSFGLLISGTVCKFYKSRKCLKKLEEQFNFRVIRIPEHSDIPGNCKADKLARLSTTIQLSEKFATVGIRLETHGSIIGSTITRTRSTTDRQHRIKSGQYWMSVVLQFALFGLSVFACELLAFCRWLDNLDKSSVMTYIILYCSGIK